MPILCGVMASSINLFYFFDVVLPMPVCWTLAACALFFVISFSFHFFHPSVSSLTNQLAIECCEASLEYLALCPLSSSFSTFSLSFYSLQKKECVYLDPLVYAMKLLRIRIRKETNHFNNRRTIPHGVGEGAGSLAWFDILVIFFFLHLFP